MFLFTFPSNFFSWDRKRRGRYLRLRKIKHSSSQSTVNQNKNVNNLKTAPKKLQQEKCNLPFFLRIILLLILEFQEKKICLIFLHSTVKSKKKWRWRFSSKRKHCRRWPNKSLSLRECQENLAPGYHFRPPPPSILGFHAKKRAANLELFCCRRYGRRRYRS